MDEGNNPETGEVVVGCKLEDAQAPVKGYESNPEAEESEEEEDDSGTEKSEEKHVFKMVHINSDHESRGDPEDSNHDFSISNDNELDLGFVIDSREPISSKTARNKYSKSMDWKTMMNQFRHFKTQVAVANFEKHPKNDHQKRNSNSMIFSMSSQKP